MKIQFTLSNDGLKFIWTLVKRKEREVITDTYVFKILVSPLAHKIPSKIHKGFHVNNI